MRKDLIALTPEQGFKEIFDYGEGAEVSDSLFGLFVNYTRICFKYPDDEQALDIDTELYYLSRMVEVFKGEEPTKNFDEFLEMEDKEDVAACFLSMYVNLTRLLIKYPNDNHSERVDFELYILGQLIHLFQGSYMVGERYFKD